MIKQGKLKYNLTPVSHPNDLHIVADHTYKFADAHQVRMSVGWVYGVEHWAFDADGVPIPFTGQQAIDAGIGPKFYCGSAWISGYTVDQENPEQLQSWS